MAELIQPATSSSWADLSSGVLNKVFASLSIRATVACERVCSSWYQILTVDPACGVWGEEWTVLNSMSGDANNSITEYGAEFRLPLLGEAQTRIWPLRRLQGVHQISLGSAKFPLGLYSQLPDNCIVHRLLAQLQRTSGPSLALHMSDPGPLLTPPQIQLLQSLCISLSVGPGLSSQHLVHICTLTSLTYLKLRFTKKHPERVMNCMPMDSLTKLQVLKELKLCRPPRLPLLLSRLASLECLSVAPRTAALLDMSSLTQVCSLRIEQGCLPSIYRAETGVPVVLPTGPTARLLALVVHTLCDIQNLHEAKELTQIEVSAKLGIMHAVSWPTALPHLHCLTVCQANDHYKFPYASMLPYRYILPDEWQHYTQLKVLHLHHFQASSLPVWFSKLQQLNKLSMPDAKMDGVPECLFQLSELKHLDLCRFQGILTMPVVKLADLPELTYLQFGKLKHAVPHYEQAVLLDLEIALSKRELRLKKEHPDEWTYVLDMCQ